MADGAGPISPHTPRNGLGVVSAILGVTSLVSLVVLIGPFVGIVAVATGVSALRRVKRGQAHHRGAAIVGIVLGLLSILLGAVFLYLGAQQSKSGCWPAAQHAGCY